MSYAKFRVSQVSIKLDCQRHFEANPDYFSGDKIAQREHWLNYTDELSRCGLISQHNRDNWSCPF